MGKFPAIPLVVVLLLLVLRSIGSTTAQKAYPQTGHGRKMAMVGGYAPIQDVQDARVVQAAEFTLQTLRSSQSTVSYSFATSLTSSDTYKVEVVKGYQQVVAGMNYRLVLRLMNDDDVDSACLGAFCATIYDHFGDLQVTTWGTEVSCDKAKAIEENAQAFHETFEQDFSN